MFAFYANSICLAHRCQTSAPRSDSHARVQPVHLMNMERRQV